MEEPIRYAGFWRRFLAFVIDNLLLGLVLTPLAFFFSTGHYLLPGGLDDPKLFITRIDWSYLLIEEVLPVVLFVFFWVRYEGTPGKRLLDCYVVDAITFGPLTIGQAVLRYIGYFVSIFTLGLGFVWIAIDKRKRGFHDMIAGSVVVIRRSSRLEVDESEKSLEQLMREAK